MPDPSAPPRLDHAAWLAAPSFRAVVAALRAGGRPARAVGGAVRNALLGRPVADIDIATPAPPEEVIRLAREAGLQVIPTGIEHGTVTVIADHRPYEVTTLRRDVETFGRHATVVYTSDWAEDARRRDFTINALYCDPDGTVFDPLGGWPDLVARRVRFIGDPHARIREDFLRILRFFRFTAEYAEAEPDAEGLAAAIAEADGIDGLSGERLRQEMLKLVVAPRTAPVLAVMDATGLLTRILGSRGDIASLGRLCALDLALGRAPDAALRLALLAATSPAAAETVRARLRLSNAEADHLRAAAMPVAGVSPAEPEDLAKALYYRQGPDAFRAAVLTAWARAAAEPASAPWRERLSLPDRFPRPMLPVRGSDVLALGVPPGPAVGRIVGDFESWWIEAGFPTDPDLVRRRLTELVIPHTGNHVRRRD